MNNKKFVWILVLILIFLASGCASAPKHEETHYIVCPLCGESFVPQNMSQNALNTCPNPACGAKIPYVKDTPPKKSRSWEFFYEDWGRPYWSYHRYNPYSFDGGVRIYRYPTYRYYHFGNYNY